MQCVITNTELSSHEGTRCQFSGSRGSIKLGIDVHQDFYVVVEQVEGTNPKPAQRFAKEAFLHWAARLRQSGAKVYAVYEACGFGFTLQRQLSVLGIDTYVVCPQKLDERNKRVKTDGLDAKALCLKLDRFCAGQPGSAGAGACAQRSRRTTAGHSSAARTAGQGAQATGSARQEFDG